MSNQLAASSWSPGPILMADQLGELTDSYADLLDDSASQQDALRSEFCQRLSNRGFRDVALLNGTIKAGGVLSGSVLAERRPYYFAQTKAGALLTVRIAAFGNDLYISWYLWSRRAINWIAVLVCFLIGIGLSYLFGGRQPVIAIAVVGLFAGIGVVILAAVLGTVLARDPLLFFAKKLTFFDNEDIRATAIGVQNSLVEAAEKIGLKGKLRAKQDFFGIKRPRIL